MGAQTAVVTGAASGIGRALAELLVERGLHVHLVDLDGPALDAVAAELGSVSARPAAGAAATIHRVDVADPAAVGELAAVVGAVDLLCLNAGVISSIVGPPWEASAEEWDRVLGVNVGGIVNGLRAFVPLLLDRGSPAHVLITASLAGAATWPGGGPYAASKHAALAVAEQAALTLADSTVSVTVLCPALVRTGMSDVGDDPLAVAAEALAALDDGRFAVIPEPWRAAVVDRAETLISGRHPTLPEPATE